MKETQIRQPRDKFPEGPCAPPQSARDQPPRVLSRDCGSYRQNRFRQPADEPMSSFQPAPESQTPNLSAEIGCPRKGRGEHSRQCPETVARARELLSCLARTAPG